MRRISTRVVVNYLALQFILLPILGTTILYFAEKSSIDTFVTNVRSYTRLIGDALESGNQLQDGDAVRNILDAVVLGGNGLYAQLIIDNKSILSELSQIENVGTNIQDLGFDQHNDDTYFLSAYLGDTDHKATLIVGFDEKPIKAEIASTRQTILVLFTTVLFASVVLLFVISHRLTQPIKSLQLHSKRVISGTPNQPLFARSGLLEIDDLAQVLEAMRSQLVGSNEQLQLEIDNRIHAEQERSKIEKLLQHAQRIEAIGTFAGGLAHEINNQLQPILLNLEILKLGFDQTQDNTVKLSKVIDRVIQTRKVVSKMMLFSQQTKQVDEAPVILDEVIMETAKWLQATIPVDISVQVDLLDQQTEVKADPAQLHQVFVNLFNNSIQAMAQGGGNLSIQTKSNSISSLSTAPENASFTSKTTSVDFILITVSDTGVGMTSQLLQRAFDPYFTSRTAGEGTGLGLSIVHGIITSLGGTVEISSELQAGTTVTISLPIWSENIDEY